MAAGDSAKRKGRKRRNSEDSDGPPRTLKQYSIEEKLEIIDFAKGNGNRAAGREYNVAESSIREWRKNEEKLKNMNVTDPDRNRLTGGGRRIPSILSAKAFEDIDKNLEVIHVPLSLSIGNGSVDPTATDGENRDDNEASLGGTSNASTHSDSPTLSVGGSSSGGGGEARGNGSGRRKANKPKKLICE